jgi:hypothetical protein
VRLWPARKRFIEPTSDPDGDGIPNLLEYALDLDPRQPSLLGLPELSVGPASISLTYRKNPAKPDVGWQVELVDDLLNDWDPIDDQLIGTDGAIEIRKATVPIEGSKKFLRLKVSRLF